MLIEDTPVGDDTDMTVSFEGPIIGQMALRGGGRLRLGTIIKIRHELAGMARHQGDDGEENAPLTHFGQGHGPLAAAANGACVPFTRADRVDRLG